MRRKYQGQRLGLRPVWALLRHNRLWPRRRMHIWCHHDRWGPGVGSRCSTGPEYLSSTIPLLSMPSLRCYRRCGKGSSQAWGKPTMSTSPVWATTTPRFRLPPMWEVAPLPNGARAVTHLQREPRLQGRPLVLITAGDQHQRHQVSNALERPEWPDGPRFITRPKRSRNRAAADEAVHEVLANMTPKEAVEHFTMHEVTIAPVNTIAIAADEPAVTNYGRELFRTRRVNHAAFDAA